MLLALAEFTLQVTRAKFSGTSTGHWYGSNITSSRNKYHNSSTSRITCALLHGAAAREDEYFLLQH